MTGHPFFCELTQKIATAPDVRKKILAEVDFPAAEKSVTVHRQYITQTFFFFLNKRLLRTSLPRRNFIFNRLALRLCQKHRNMPRMRMHRPARDYMVWFFKIPTGASTNQADGIICHERRRCAMLFIHYTMILGMIRTAQERLWQRQSEP